MAAGMTDDPRARLAQALDQAQDRAMTRAAVWGRDDCALWVAEIVKAALGTDPAARFRNRYTTPIGYLRVLRREGFQNLSEVITAAADEMGWPQLLHEADAQIGDIGVTTNGKHFTACMSNGRGFWIARSEMGWAALPGSLMAFRVVS